MANTLKLPTGNGTNTITLKTDSHRILYVETNSSNETVTNEIVKVNASQNGSSNLLWNKLDSCQSYSINVSGKTGSAMSPTGYSASGSITLSDYDYIFTHCEYSEKPTFISTSSGNGYVTSVVVNEPSGFLGSVTYTINWLISGVSTPRTNVSGVIRIYAIEKYVAPVVPGPGDETTK